MMRSALLVFSLAVLTACGSTGTMHGGYPAYLARHGIDLPVTEGEFPHCHGYGCRNLSAISLSKADWQAIDKTMRGASTPARERAAIRRAVAAFETRVGRIAGTDKDAAGTYVALDRRHHDCVDESINTTVYLALLEQRGRLKFHTVATPTARTLFSGAGLGPHQTAVIVENNTGARFAVDSWFHDNGVPPEIVDLAEWRSGWRPAKDSPAHSPSSKTRK